MKTRLAIIVASLAIPFLASAHGGWQKVIDGKYMISLSPAPISLFAGEEQKYLLGFADLQDNLIEKNISVDVRVTLSGRVISDRKDMTATGGILTFSQTYTTAGLYELFVAFRVPGDPQTYQAEDYYIDARPLPAMPESQKKGTSPIEMLVFIVFGVAIGAGGMTLWRMAGLRRKR